MRAEHVPPLPLAPLTVYLTHAAAGAFAFTLFATLASVYRFQDVGLTPLQLILVGTVLEATVLLAELPTGVVADAISRRLSLIVGTVLIGVGFALEGLIPTFAAVLAAQVVWGLGAAFESGSVQAWISDEVGEVRASRAFLRAAQIRHAAALAGIAAAALFGRTSLGAPLVAGGAGFLLLAGFLWLSMRESPFEPAEGVQLDPFRAIAGTLRRGRDLADRRPVVWTILGVAVLVGASSETFDRLWEARMIAGPGLPTGLDAPTWFALIATITTVLGILVLEAARRMLDRLDPEGRFRRPLIGMLLGMALVRGAAVAGFGLAGRIDLAVAMYLLARVSQGIHVPLYQAWLNRELEPGTRATAFSAAGLSDALGQVIGGPLLGLVAAAAGMPAAFVAAAAILGPAALLLERSRRREPRSGGGVR